MGLSAEDFGTFFTEVHGHHPFLWQQDLAREVVERGSWPSLVDVPTGLGKTSVLDVAIFLTAQTAGDCNPGRLGRRRIFLVVDRRIVVDQAHDHATLISRRLRDAEAGSVCAEVARSLSSLSGPAATRGRLAGGPHAGWHDVGRGVVATT